MSSKMYSGSSFKNFEMYSGSSLKCSKMFGSTKSSLHEDTLPTDDRSPPDDWHHKAINQLLTLSNKKRSPDNDCALYLGSCCLKPNFSDTRMTKMERIDLSTKCNF